jgi:hypothetical protein
MKPIAATAVKLRFAREFSEQDAFEARSRGYLSHVLVELEGGKLYPVFFYDPTRLQQDLAEGVRCGHPFVADPGMIVVPEVSPQAMQDAADRLVEDGFFEHLTAITEHDLESGDPYAWPPEKQKGSAGQGR